MPYGCGKVDGSAARGFALGMSGARITSGLHWVSWCRGPGRVYREDTAAADYGLLLQVGTGTRLGCGSVSNLAFTIWCGNGAVCGGWKWRRGRGKGMGGTWHVQWLSTGCPLAAHEPSRVASRLSPAEHTPPRFAPRRVSIVTYTPSKPIQEGACEEPATSPVADSADPSPRHPHPPQGMNCQT